MAKYILGSIFNGEFPITQGYGENPQIYTMFAVPGHEGVDWGCPNGTEVVAPFDGIILRDTFNDKDYGNFTVVWDPVQHCAVWYCHLQDVTTQSGDKVTKGQIVGHTNNTGHSTGPHLHVDFVETDASGNRLNLNNGKQGFLNINDPSLVEWKLGSNAIPAQPLAQLNDQTKYDFGGEIGIQELGAVKSIINDSRRDIKNIQAQLEAVTASDKTDQEKIVELQGIIDQLKATPPPATPPVVPETAPTPPVDTTPTPPKFDLITWIFSLFK